MPKFLLTLLVVGVTQGLAATLIEYGSYWSYYLGTTEASSPDRAAWRRNAFDDRSWAQGAAPIGYSTSPNNAAEEALVTLLPTSQEGNYRSVFLRRSFTVNNPAAVGELTLSVSVDDGFVAWINGQLAASYNVPGTDPAYDTQASNALEPALISAVLTNLAQVLLPGTNILAVQVFNANLTSSDLVFDAVLSSDSDEVAPRVLEVTPPAGALVRELSLVEVFFDESVTGVDASDLSVNGTPASELTQVSPRDYVFGIAQPPPGTATVSWATGHGIKDLAGNPFVGTNWTYKLDPTLAAPSLVISEFMADNQHGIRDEDANRSDWIEIYNAGGEAVNLLGWSLTDHTNSPGWRFPAMWLDPNKYLLVWASGKNRADPALPLHTDFKLGKEVGYLALLDAATNIVSAFAPAYPAQLEDVSYGRDVVEPSVVGFFLTPTPGQRNATSGPGFAPAPAFSIEGGVYTNNSLSVALSTPAGQTRYTLDGSVPTTNSPAYYGPLTVNASTTVKARVFQPGMFPGPVMAQTYMLLDSTVARFTSNLPLMIISTSGRGIVSHPAPGTPRTFASVVAIDTERGRSSPLGSPDYFGQGGISIRGQTSSGFPKRPYRLELQDAYLDDRDAPLLGLPAESDWILNNPYSDKPFLQNFLAMELFEKMGHYSVRRRFVEVFINTTSGKVTYPRDYMGIYVLLEKIKVADDRVNIRKLTPSDNSEPNITGGYMFKKDKDTTGDLNFTTPGGGGFGGQTLKIHEPVPREITSAQLTWLRNYLGRMEAALYASDWKLRTGTNHYSHYLDVDSFADHHWIVEFSKQIDGYRLSNYMQKDRGGKVKMEPIWDWNLSFGNADYLGGGETSGWYWSQLGANEHIWFRRLMCGTTSAAGTTGDPDFNQKIIDRWSVLRTNVLALSNVLARVDELAGYLNDAAQRDFQKWPRLGTYIWPNPPLYSTPTTYAGIITSMKNWISGRHAWIDAQYLRVPAFSLNGGRVPPGHNVIVTAPAGLIYYTLDGTDPRAPGGGLATGAQLYRGPVPISSNARLVARAMSGSRWSGPTAATFVVNPPQLQLTEIMYHPGDPPPGSSFDAEDFEFLEFRNTGAAPVNLQGFSLNGAVGFTFPSYTLAAGQRVLVVKSRAAFESRYGGGLPIAGEFTGNLHNAAERIVLTGRLGETALDFTYEDSWHKITDGSGFSLVTSSEAAPAPDPAQASAWRPSSSWGGSPGDQDPSPALIPSVVVNEVLSNPSGSEPDLIEVQNLSGENVDIGGWFLSDNAGEPQKFRIPSPTILAPGELKTFSGAGFSTAGATGVLRSFALSADGEEVFLFSGGASTNLTGYMHGFSFGAQHTNRAFGRHVDSLGREHFVTQSAPSFGSTNPGPRIPDVVISEVMYHPPDVFTNGAFWNNTDDEFVELFNRGNNPVPLFDPASPTNTWQLSGDLEFRFPTNLVLAANSYLVLAGFDPQKQPVRLAAFRARYAIPVHVPIVGPFAGHLDNRRGTLELSEPRTPPGTAPVHVLVESMEYEHDLPWPPGADGLGFSLNRTAPNAFGNDPANWGVRLPSPGRAMMSAGDPITILQHPISQAGFTGQELVLRVAAAGDSGLKVQWRFNGDFLPGATNATLVLPNAQPGMTGEYLAVVSSGTDSVASAPAYVLVEPDSDADGIPDDWELDHGLNPFVGTDAHIDTDGDGMTNRDEYVAGTDPGDSSSFLKLSNLPVNGGCEICFDAAAFRTYTIFYTETLIPAAWVKLADIPSRPAPFRASVADPAGNPVRYYRVGVGK